MAFFEYEGNQVFYEELGSGKPLLLLHGNAVSSKLFNDYREFLAEKFRVIMLDFPGLGRSSRLITFRDDFWLYNAKVSFQLMDMLGYDKFDIIGTSGGAITGLNMCVLQPERIGKIIADSFFGDSLSFEDAEYLVNKRQKSKNNFMTVQYWKFHNGDDWEGVIDNDCDLMLNFTSKNLPAIYGDLSKISAETLFVATSTDELLPNILSRLDELAEKIPNVKKKYYDYGRHTFMITEKEEFRKIIHEFLL